ncbi:MAG TPA: MFS transporter [Anaerolineales bacterium]|nr:MFS transporter [Anaerolineales bacterium]
MYYFLWIGAGGCLSPFVTLFYKARGLSGTEIGLLSTFGAITGMLAAPIWGRWGDASRHPRRLIMLALLASAAFALLRGIQSLFWSISLFIILDSLIGSGASSLSIVQAHAVTRGEKSGFGSIRLWGSLGWAAVTPLAGLLIERLGLYVPFAGYAAMLVASVCVLFFVRGTTEPIPEEEKPQRPPVLQTVRGLIGNRAILGVALALVTIWIATNGRSQFETLYMNQLGASAGLIGIANTVSALFEVPFMLLADRLIHRYGSGRILLISILVQAASFLPIVLVPSIPSFFIVRIMASIALSLNVPSYYNYLIESAPNGQGGTVVSLFDVTLRSGVSLLAAPLSGYLYDLLGGYWLYAIGLGGCLLAFLILGMLSRPSLAQTV